MHSVLTARIILNIRESASQRLGDVSFDLHLSDAGSRTSRARMSFARGPVAFCSDDDRENDIPTQGRLDNMSVAWIGMTSFSNSTTESLDQWPETLRGERAAGRDRQ